MHCVNVPVYKCEFDACIHCKLCAGPGFVWEVFSIVRCSHAPAHLQVCDIFHCHSLAQRKYVPTVDLMYSCSIHYVQNIFFPMHGTPGSVFDWDLC